MSLKQKMRSVVAVSAVGVSIWGGMGSAQPAAADSVGCTGAPGGYQCLGLYGSGSYLRSTRVSYQTIPSWGTICRSRARWTSPIGTFYSSYNGGCVWNTAWYDLGVYRNAAGTWCGTMRSDRTGDSYPSPACNRVG